MIAYAGHCNANSQPMIFEYVEQSNQVASNVNEFVLRPISASEAFRRYNWLKLQPVMNRSGNLRGMVINRQMRVVYTISEKSGKYLTLMAMLLEVGKEMSRMKEVYQSDVDGAEKASRILLLGSSGILRAVTSVVPAAVGLLAMSVQGYAQLYSLATGSPSGNALSDKAGAFAEEVKAIHSRQWDGENWYNVVEATLK